MGSNTDKEAPASFVKFVEDLADGQFARDAAIDLQRLGDELHTQAINQGVKVKGELTIKLKITCEKNGVATLVPTIDLKMPKRPTMGGVMWMTKGGNFSPQSAKQLALAGVREIVRSRETPRDVPRAPAEHEDDGDDVDIDTH